LLLSRIREDLHRNVEQKKSTTDLERILNILLDAIRDIRMAPVPGLVLESALLSLCGPSDFPAETPKRPAPTVPHNAPPAPPTNQPISQSSNQPVNQSTNQPINQLTSHPINQLTNQPVIQSTNQPSTPLSLHDVKSVWPDVVRSTEPASARTSLKSGMVHGLEGTTLYVSFGSLFHKDKVSTAEAGRSIEEGLHKALGVKLSFKPVMEEEAMTHSPALTQSTPPQDEEVDLASAASDIF
jgi:DNA polymerase III gamma/tau subunit